jgi:NAD(P)H-dependent flavin oxidoreductase YrpB (nitropropane dioxygenase family)
LQSQIGQDRHLRRKGTSQVEAALVLSVALYAGQGVGQVTDLTPAAQVVAELTQDTARLLRR